MPHGCSWCHPQGHVANLRLSISAPTAPRPRMHTPRRCCGVVKGRLPRPFRTALLAVFSPRWDASPSVLGTRPPSVAHLFCVHCFVAAEVPLGRAERPSPHLLKGRERAVTALLPEALERSHGVRGAQPATPASGRQALEPSGRLSLGGHGERKKVLWGAGKRIRCASS